MRLTDYLAAALLSMSAGLAADTAPEPEIPSERVVSFDYGSLDTLDALGLGKLIVAVPNQGLPEYLSQYAQGYPDAGGLKTPDLQSIRQVAPTLTLVTGRQNELLKELEAVAPVMDTTLGGSEYMEAFGENVARLAERFDASARAEQALGTLHGEIGRARQSIQGTPEVLVVTHNKGSFMLNTHPVVHQVLGLKQPAIPVSVKSEKRGDRTFTRLSPEVMAEIGPDLILIVDRSAAIGDGGVDAQGLRQSLSDNGVDNIPVAALTPELWYLSGGGLQSLDLQIEEVLKALQDIEQAPEV